MFESAADLLRGATGVQNPYNWKNYLAAAAFFLIVIVPLGAICFAFLVGAVGSATESGQHILHGRGSHMSRRRRR